MLGLFQLVIVVLLCTIDIGDIFVIGLSLLDSPIAQIHLEDMENINWSDLRLEKRTTPGLMMLHKASYHRYDSPNRHFLNLFAALMLLCFGCMLFVMSLTVQDFPHPERVTMFWLSQIVVIGLGTYLMHKYFQVKRKSEREWEEMEGIRKQIDDELKRRDELLGIGEKDKN